MKFFICSLFTASVTQLASKQCTSAITNGLTSPPATTPGTTSTSPPPYTILTLTSPPITHQSGTTLTLNPLTVSPNTTSSQQCLESNKVTWKTGVTPGKETQFQVATEPKETVKFAAAFSGMEAKSAGQENFICKKSFFKADWSRTKDVLEQDGGREMSWNWTSAVKSQLKYQEQDAGTQTERQIEDSDYTPIKDAFCVKQWNESKKYQHFQHCVFLKNMRGLIFIQQQITDNSTFHFIHVYVIYIVIFRTISFKRQHSIRLFGIVIIIQHFNNDQSTAQNIK
ncbi:Hypothetical_protein [Hexamita inflata]|uniref:Hypothetical_protein n=1 Tax=Hexamita inflata TaxID=28002 RepID=A0AA86TJ34_9EUKA|nr:Hypothetical protein HINF_LOCUS7874 [Hexamita inflata]